MRLFYAALALEANTFLPVPTSYQAFLDKLYYPPGKHPEKAGHQTGAIAAVRAAAKRDGFELIEGSCYAAQPGGTASRAAYERMRDEILGQLKAALPLDGHGAHGERHRGVGDPQHTCRGLGQVEPEGHGHPRAQRRYRALRVERHRAAQETVGAQAAELGNLNRDLLDLLGS